MTGRLVSKIRFITSLLVIVIEIISIARVSGEFNPQEQDLLDVVALEDNENEVDQNDVGRVIPWALRSIITEEVANYEIPTDVQSRFPYYLSGFDDDGRPVWVSESGKWDIRYMIDRGIEAQTDMDRCLYQGVYRILNSTQIMATEDEPVDQIILIVDMEGFGLKQITSIPTLKYILSKYRMFAPAFPKLYSCYLINTNYAAETLLHLVKPILGSTFAKIEVFGNIKSKWVPQLLKNIPRDQIPEWYGGYKEFTPYQIYG